MLENANLLGPMFCPCLCLDPGQTLCVLYHSLILLYCHLHILISNLSFSSLKHNCEHVVVLQSTNISKASHLLLLFYFVALLCVFPQLSSVFQCGTSKHKLISFSFILLRI